MSEKRKTMLKTKMKLAPFFIQLEIEKLTQKLKKGNISPEERDKLAVLQDYRIQKNSNIFKMMQRIEVEKSSITEKLDIYQKERAKKEEEYKQNLEKLEKMNF